MKYYLCIVGSFQDGGEEEIKNDCLTRNVYQYHKTTHQKGAGDSIDIGDTLIFIYKKEIIAYGNAAGHIGSATGYDNSWLAVSVRGGWQCSCKPISLPYGVYWHTLRGTKQSVVKEIDALWANELLLPLLAKDTKENVVSLHVPTIVAFFKNGFLSIPAVQRGKVWNAVRVEILWDSLLRNIPIGSLSFKPVNDDGRTTWSLMDGQQRVNALALGYAPFPSQAENGSLSRDSILWIDLGINNEEIEQSDGALKKSARRFFFRVTTAAHPWGYALSDNETRNKTLSVPAIRESLCAINWTETGKKPAPSKLWPHGAKFPVPFSVLRSYCDETCEPSFDAFWEFCRRAYQECNWFKHLEQKKDSFDISAITSALQKLNDIRIPLQNATNVPDEDIGLYFARMNKAGIVPNTEEIQYSLLKAKLPELKKLDRLAEGRMQPARLASIAMLAYLTKKDNKWASQITNAKISELAKDKEFQTYISADLEIFLESVDKALVYNKNETCLGLPRVLVSKLALNNPELYRLFIILMHANIAVESKSLVAIATLVSWFGNNHAEIAKSGFEHLVKSGTPQKAVKEWLFEAILKGWLLIPPPCCVYETIVTATQNSTNPKDIENTWNPIGYRSAINQTWGWTSTPGRGLLLYAVRDYLQTYFGDYDPADTVWNEENCPWDYDHIFPQAWLRGQGRIGHGKYHNLVAEFLNSIGNIAPLPFSVNRGKGDDAPGKYQEEDNELLFVREKDNSAFFANNQKEKLEDREADALKFANITAKRLKNIYASWYDTLGIGELLNFANLADPRRDLFAKIQQAHPETKIYYVAENGRQNELTRPSDWARPWLSCGRIFQNIDIGNGKKANSLVGITSNGQNFKIGFRRTPDQTEIEGNPNSWYYKEMPLENDNSDAIYGKVILLLQTMTSDLRSN